MTRRAELAHHALTRALIDAAARGQRPRCADAEVAWMFTDGDDQILMRLRTSTGRCFPQLVVIDLRSLCDLWTVPDNTFWW
jgi:hypothetical protein